MYIMREGEIIHKIKEFIHSDSPSSYYVGIAEVSKVRLTAHSALHAKSVSIEADTVEIARRVERYFVNVIRTDGGAGGGDDNSVHVYCYKKDNTTIERT